MAVASKHKDPVKVPPTTDSKGNQCDALFTLLDYNSIILDHASWLFSTFRLIQVKFVPLCFLGLSFTFLWLDGKTAKAGK